MLLGSRWYQLLEWWKRLPLWAQLAVGPVIAPVVLPVCAVCLCPRTSVLAGSILVGFYGVLTAAGHIGWRHLIQSACDGVGMIYLGLVVVGYVASLEALVGHVFGLYDDSSSANDRRANQRVRVPPDPAGTIPQQELGNERNPST